VSGSVSRRRISLSGVSRGEGRSGGAYAIVSSTIDGGSGRIDVSDVFFLINFLFAGGSAPAPPDC
jgi:hypothetical protein